MAMMAHPATLASPLTATHAIFRFKLHGAARHSGRTVRRGMEQR
jgi:hypothetical protein